MCWFSNSQNPTKSLFPYFKGEKAVGADGFGGHIATAFEKGKVCPP